MRKIIGILLLLVAILVLTRLLSEGNINWTSNYENLFRRSALFGIISIGAALVIIVGGIDLSIGSVIALIGCLVPWLMVHHEWSAFSAISLGMLISLGIGLFHGVLVARCRIQPFIVTLCGLLLYRGIIRGLTDDQTQGFGLGFDTLRQLGTGRIPIPFMDSFELPVPVVILAVIAIAVIVFLRCTTWGRYFFAIGRNETAARYSGIPTYRMTILAYMLCSLLAGFGGLLFVLDTNSAQPADFGNFYELYAIAAAVLGGCSLRGGEGTIIGVLIGAAIMQALGSSITLLDWIPNTLEYAVIGGVILLGVLVDEAVRRVIAMRQRRYAHTGRSAMLEANSPSKADGSTDDEQP